MKLLLGLIVGMIAVVFLLAGVVGIMYGAGPIGMGALLVSMALLALFAAVAFSD